MVLKTATGHVTVKLSPELAAIVLDPNGGMYSYLLSNNLCIVINYDEILEKKYN